MTGHSARVTGCAVAGSVSLTDRPEASVDAGSPRRVQGGQTGRADPLPAEPGSAEMPELLFEVRRTDGLVGRQLAREQAMVIREVLGWIARRRSGIGQEPAGPGD